MHGHRLAQGRVPVAGCVDRSREALMAAVMLAMSGGMLPAHPAAGVMMTPLALVLRAGDGGGDPAPMMDDVAPVRALRCSRRAVMMMSVVNRGCDR